MPKKIVSDVGPGRYNLAGDLLKVPSYMIKR